MPLNWLTTSCEQAPWRSSPVGHVWVGLACDVKPVGVWEHILVPVGRLIQCNDALACSSRQSENCAGFDLCALVPIPLCVNSM
jgi:hypothetical protein